MECTGEERRRSDVCITENEAALKKVAVSETAKLLTEYEEKHSMKTKGTEPPPPREQIPILCRRRSCLTSGAFLMS